MADVFISYKREEQGKARQLADALEKIGWSVWWDPKLRAGEYFDDVIEKALKEARCVIVLWSKRSVQSRYVRDESSYALERNKLVPVAVEAVELPFRFRGIHTAQLIGWDGSQQFLAFRKLVDDIHAVVGEPKTSPDDIAQQAGEALQERGTVSPGPVREPLSSFHDPLRDGGEGPEMVVIPAGSFWMGSPQGEPRRFEDEGPRHRVEIPRPFALGKTAVTFEAYDRFAEATGRNRPSHQDWGRDSRPVINVSWDDAVAYAEWLSEQTGKRYRMPTEAEWEYACRAGTETPFSTGNCIHTDQANYNGKENYNNCGAKTGVYREKTVPTGSLPPNPWGLHEMHGNVWEWVRDCWHESYEGAPDDGAAWEEAGGGDCGHSVLRGGAWSYEPLFLRSAGRSLGPPGYRLNDLGFRLAQDLDE